MPSKALSKYTGWLGGCLAGMALLAVCAICRAEPVILHLRNGDRITGTIISETTNLVVISNAWNRSIAVPITAIERREKVAAKTTAAPVAPPGPEQQKISSVPKPAVTKPAVTNVVGAAKPPGSAGPAPTAKPKTETKPAAVKHWRGDVRVGMDLVYGARDRRTYYARGKLTYEKPHATNPRQFFRNTFDYSVEYGKIADRLSANRMNGSVKTDFDISRHFFAYNLGGAGYDEVRKIHLQYEEGPGAGCHLLTRTNFVLDAETGLEYQVQERSDGTKTEDVFLRLAESITWKVANKVTITEKAEFFPNAGDIEQFRARGELTLSYWLVKGLSLNLSLLDLYDTQPARNVSRNELQIRSSIGFTF